MSCRRTHHAHRNHGRAKAFDSSADLPYRTRCCLLSILILPNPQHSYYIITMALPPSSGGAIKWTSFNLEIVPVLQLQLLGRRLLGNHILARLLVGGSRFENVNTQTLQAAGRRKEVDLQKRPLAMKIQAQWVLLVNPLVGRRDGMKMTAIDWMTFFMYNTKAARERCQAAEEELSTSITAWAQKVSDSQSTEL